jgi:hypothetical protein
MSKVQGEGDYEAAKRFNEAETAFVKSGKVKKGIEDAAPHTPEEEKELEDAENEGLSHVKEEDPQVERKKDSSKI